MADRRNVLVIGDSNIRDVMDTQEMRDLDKISAPGCSFWSPKNAKWIANVRQSLQNRLHQKKVKFLVVHFGTCDEGKQSEEFIDGVKAFITMVHAHDSAIKIIISKVLRRHPAFRIFNILGQADKFNEVQKQFNKKLEDMKMANCTLVGHTELDLMKKDCWKDSVHLSRLGAGILARDLNNAIEEALAEAKTLAQPEPEEFREHPKFTAIRYQFFSNVYELIDNNNNNS